VKKKRAKKPRRVRRQMPSEWDLAELDHVRRRLALPEAERMNFLLIKLPGGGYAL